MCVPGNLNPAHQQRQRKRWSYCADSDKHVSHSRRDLIDLPFTHRRKPISLRLWVILWRNRMLDLRFLVDCSCYRNNWANPVWVHHCSFENYTNNLLSLSRDDESAECICPIEFGRLSTIWSLFAAVVMLCGDAFIVSHSHFARHHEPDTSMAN